MKVLLKQHYQDARCHLYPDKQYEVADDLGAFLVKNRMAEKIEEQPIIIEKHLEVEPQFEQAEEPPQPVEKPARRARRA